MNENSNMTYTSTTKENIYSTLLKENEKLRAEVAQLRETAKPVDEALLHYKQLECEDLRAENATVVYERSEMFKLLIASSAKARVLEDKNKALRKALSAFLAPVDGTFCNCDKCLAAYAALDERGTDVL